MNIKYLCTIKQYAKARCDYLVDVQLFKNTENSFNKFPDGIERYCNYYSYCPQQEKIEMTKKD